jgi:hypothetical protein
MAKKEKVAPQQIAVTLVIGARGAKYTGKETVHGTTGHGNMGTWAHVKEIVEANGGTITPEEALSACIAVGHKGYFRYMLRNMWLVPQA